MMEFSLPVDYSIKKEGPYEFKSGVAFKVSAVSLEKHNLASEPIPDPVSNSIDNINSHSRLGIVSDADSNYLSMQIDKFLEGKDIPKEITLEELIRISYGIVKAGTGDHDGTVEPVSYTDCIDLDNPKPTKCEVFNSLFRVIFEKTANKLAPDLNKSHRLINTNAMYAPDLGGSKFLVMDDHGGKIQKINHKYLTIVSMQGDNFIYTPIDPYHVGSPSEVVYEIDFSGRTPDSVRMLVKSLMEMETFSGARKDYLKSYFYLQKIDELESSRDKAGLGLIITNELWSAFQASKSLAKNGYDSSRELYGNWIRAIRDTENPTIKEYTRVGLKAELVANFDSFLDQKKRSVLYESLEKKMVNSLISITNSLEKDIKIDGEINFEDLTYLMSLVDNCGRNGIPLGLEEWKKINAFVKENVLGDQAALSKGKERIAQYKILMREGNVKYNKKPDVAIFRSHFISHGMDAPLIFQLTPEDKDEISTPEDIQYQEFKANMVAVAKRIGIDQIDVYLPNGEYKSGTKAWYFRNFLRSSI